MLFFLKKISLFWFCKFLCLDDLRIFFCPNKHKLGCNYSLSSINTTWDPSREHWWGLIIFRFIGILDNLIEYLCLKYLVRTSKWRVELLFFQFSLWEILESYIFDQHTKVWIREFGLQLCFFSTQEGFTLLIFLVGHPPLYITFSVCRTICLSIRLPRTISQESCII